MGPDKKRGYAAPGGGAYSASGREVMANAESRAESGTPDNSTVQHYNHLRGEPLGGRFIMWRGMPVGSASGLSEDTKPHQHSEDAEIETAEPGQPGSEHLGPQARVAQARDDRGSERRRGGLTAEQAESLAKRLEAYREWHSLTQEEFAALAGFSRNTVNNIESGRGASKAVRKKLARLFGVSPAALFDSEIRWQAPGREVILGGV